MTSRELGNELECIVKDLCEFANKQDKYVLEIVDKIKSDLEILETLKNHIEVNSLEYLYKGEPKFVYYIDLIKKTLNEDEYNLLKERLNGDK